MATGRGTQLTRQIGEHLVAAELGRLGSAPFAGNVPLYDLMAADSQGHAMPIQVKAINKGSWQYSVDTYLNIEVENGHRVIKGKKKLPNPNLICIFVLLKGRGKDEFYVFRLSDLREYTARIYKGRGPHSKNPNSRHCPVTPKDFSDFKENWKLLETALQPPDTHPIVQHI